jgi:hypothetical protein
MEFRTVVEIAKPDFEIRPCEEMLFVGSCFADSIGQCFREEGFPVIVNPHGTMYNPVSILHTIEHLVEGGPSVVPSNMQSIKTAFLTLGTNHVYRLKETGEIVDNCEKRPASLFQEEELSVDVCANYLRMAIDLLRQANPEVRIVLTVSPIRYRKYGYHGSQLSKATLLLAVDKVMSAYRNPRLSVISWISYFPAYEILNDELRDYRFYAPDMLHPSQQAVDYIWERLVETYFSAEATTFLSEWQPLKQALGHKPFNPDSEAYKILMDKTMLKVAELREKYPTFAL